MVLSMRLSGYNANRIGTEPMNGQGIYSASGTLAASWIVTAAVAGSATLAVSWDLRQFAAQSLAPVWNLLQFAAQSIATTWDLRQFAAHSLAALWDVSSGVVASIQARWNLPFLKRHGTALSKATPAGALTRHSATTPITES